MAPFNALTETLFFFLFSDVQLESIVSKTPRNRVCLEIRGSDC